MPNEEKLPPDTMTVIIRDDSPMIFCGDGPSYRSVRVKLTEKQRKALALRCTGNSSGTDIWEDISRVIIESPRDHEEIPRLRDELRYLKEDVPGMAREEE
ncbi:hypothetical protein [Desulfovibrio sp. ZJ369]|uniref:hypothetical protein n=1 Tax=Desulfovibrio sp. ZJ369 TaxID=2709793 RepID=UPI0013EA4C30|nr:hypothetical protein [Desulfovibrio sp. ZJ369]